MPLINVRGTWDWLKLLHKPALLLLILYAGGCSHTPVRSKPPPPARKQANINICLADKVQASAVRGIRNAQEALHRFAHLYSAYSPGTPMTISTQLKSQRECPDLKTPTCMASKGEIYCDGISLARVMTSVAMMASAWTVRNGETFLTKQARPSNSLPIRPLQALDMTDSLYFYHPHDLEHGDQQTHRHDGEQGALAGALVFNAMMSWRGTSREIDTTFGLTGLIQDYHSAHASTFKESADSLKDANWDGIYQSLPLEERIRLFSLASGIYEVATNLILAHLFGHEVAHSHGICTVYESSLVEKTKLLDNLASLQRNSFFSCENTQGTTILSATEMSAEKCGLRVVNQTMNAVRIEITSKSFLKDSAPGLRTLLSVAQSISTQTMATMLSYGLAERAEGLSKAAIDRFFEGKRPAPLPEIRLPPGYLLPSFRAFLFAQELRLAWHWRISAVDYCGDAARLFVEGFQKATSRCATERAANTTQAGQQLLEALGPNAPEAFVKFWGTTQPVDTAVLECTERQLEAPVLRFLPQ